MNPQYQAYLAFTVITLFWGVTFPLIRISVQILSPPQFVMLRFASALMLLLPLMIHRLFKKGSSGLKTVFWKGLFLGAISWVSYQTQTIGLQTVEAGRAAFITGTSVVIIPLISPLFGRGKPSWIDFAAALMALFGLFLLTDPSGQSISTGDLWVILCAVFYAVYVHTFQLWVRKKDEAIYLTFCQILGVFLCAFGLNLTQPLPLPHLNTTVIASILICTFFSTVLATLLQTKFQPWITPEKAALIFSLESVFASIFGYFILGEVLSVQGIMGCLLIFGAIVGSELIKWKFPTTSKEELELGIPPHFE